MRQIPLTRGLYALVDDEDYAEFGGYNWQAVPKGNGNYYAKRSHWDGTKESTVLMHRQVTNCPKGMQVDHIDGNGLNNCRSNLRICTSAQNNTNSRRSNSKQYRGVFRYLKNGWRCGIRANGSRIDKYGFTTAEDAARAYDELARRHHGEFARLNFPA